MSNKKNFVFLTLVVMQICILCCTVKAAEAPVRPDNFTADYPVYNSNTDENIISLSWDASTGADFYILEINSDSNWAGETITEEVQVTDLTYDDIRQNDVSSPTSGTIINYKLYAAKYKLDEDGNPTSEYVTSSNYASVTVLTDPAVSATALSTSEIKLKWDDIQYNGGSIDYEIQLYKNSVKVGQEQINAEDIGDTVNRVNGKIEYIVGSLDKSTEYSFRLVPVLNSNEIKFNPYVEISGATNISAYLQRYNESIIKLTWDEYQGSVPASDLYYKVIEITQENNQKVYRVIATPQVPYYYIQIKDDKEYSYLIEVRNKNTDEKVAESAEVSMTDIVIPSTPSTPELECTPQNNSIELLWDVKKNINEVRDTEMKYDVWLFTESDYIDNVRKFYNSEGIEITDSRIATDLEIIDGNSSNPNFSLEEINGEDKYKFDINGLDPNTDYYIGVVAKKTYLMQDPEDPELIVSLSYQSEPAIQAVKTTSGNLEQPIALIEPQGVSIKTDEQGKALITSSSITIEWPMGETINGNFEKFYDNDVYFKVGYEEYTQNFNKDKINNPDEPNYNIREDNVTIVREAEEAYAEIAGLTKNTSYVFWVKAYRDVQTESIITKISEASDPIIVATLPDYSIPDATPPVPALSVLDNEYHDKVTVKFNSIAGMKYTIGWGTEDSVSKQVNQKEYIPSSSLNPDSVVVDELEPDTTYYFRIKATNNEKSSEWSDSVIGITTPIPPPEEPQGFGIKKISKNRELVPDIGEHHISLQWDKQDSINYIIEIATNEDFKSCDQVEVENVSEYKIEKFKEKELSSNTRYWVRLFAKDTSTEKVSQSSPYLTVKTKFSYDEYDSSSEKETIDKENVVEEVIDETKGTWNVDVTGAKADVIIEKIKKQDTPDYNLDLSSTSVYGINTRKVEIPYRVINELSSTQQNLIVKTDKAEFTLLPETLNLNMIKEMDKKPGHDIIIKIIIDTLDSIERDNGFEMLSHISNLKVVAVSQAQKQIIKFNKPIKIKLKYDDNSNEGSISSYNIGPNSSTWTKIESEKITENNESYLIAFNDLPGKYSVRKELINLQNLGIYKYKQKIKDILSTGKIKSVDLSNVNPIQPVTLDDAVKMLLDCVESEYGNDFMLVAEKAGLLDNIDDTNSSRELLREEATTMIMKLFELKTGQTLPQVSIPNTYYDVDKINDENTKYIANAIQMDILTPSTKYIRPNAHMTRGEMLIQIKRLLDVLKTY